MADQRAAEGALKQGFADNLRATDSSMEANESETENSFSNLLGGL